MTINNNSEITFNAKNYLLNLIKDFETKIINNEKEEIETKKVKYLIFKIKNTLTKNYNLKTKNFKTPISIPINHSDLIKSKFSNQIYRGVI